jgi:hypothetical protein
MNIPIPTDLDISPEDMEAGLVTLTVEFSINVEENTMTPISIDGVGLDMEESLSPASTSTPAPEDESMESYVASQRAAMM